jgi:hypothetical protein
VKWLETEDLAVNTSMYLPAEVLHTLRVTGAYAGGMPVDDVIAAAVWAFAQQHTSFQAALVREYWTQDQTRPQPTKPRAKLWEKAYEIGRRFLAALRRGFTGPMQGR